jgi:N-acetylglucosamine-6-phosphate deacetylase
MQEALNWGLRHVTHAFNAMPPIHHRQPGLLTSALTHSEVMIELIADGVHIHPGVLEMALQLKPIGRVCLVSDGTRAVGMPDGNYDLGGQLTRVSQGIVRLADGTLAGSAQPLLHGVRTLVNRVNWPLQKAVHYASLNPAQLLGIDDRLGSLELGKEATFLRLTPELRLKEVWLKGKLVVQYDK